MSFLSIAFLSALPLAGAPLLLHFFDRRRNVVIEWGAMQFLEEAATRRTSARRLKEWLLLLMRTAALLALILALARPLVPGNWFSSTRRSEMIIIIDNSMSMMRTVDGQQLFEQVVGRAEELVTGLSAGESARILAASPYPVWVTPGSVRINSATRSALIEQLDAVRPAEGSSDLLAALLTAVQADADPDLEQRQIAVLTDGQATDWKLEDVAGWQRFRDVLSEAPIATQLEVIRLDAVAGTRNLAVNEIRSSRSIVGVNQPFTLTAQIQNHSRQGSPAGRLGWIVDAKQHAEQALPAIEGGASREFVWKHAFDRTGVFALSCQLAADDDLEADNRATVVVEVVERIPVLLVENSDELTDTQRDAFFVQAALGRMETETSEWQSVFEPRTVSPDLLETVELDNYRAIVVPNVIAFSEDAVRRVRDFVSQGGGLWLALGPRTDIDLFNHYFFNEGDGLSPLSLAGAVMEDRREDSSSKINPFGKEHPAVAALADVERLDLGDVSVTGRLRFHTGISYEDVSTLLELTNGEPLAVENYVGPGRVIVQSIPLRHQWSGLVLSQSFVVMVHDWLAYLTQPRATRHNLLPGDPISVYLADTLYTEAILTTPHGDEIDVSSEPSGDGVVFRSNRTILPGGYALELGLSGERIPFYVARNPQESNLAGLASVDRRLLAEMGGLGKNRTRQIAGTNQYDPLWPLLLLILIALIAGELTLSGAIARQRFGSEAIAETTEDWLQKAQSDVEVDRQPPAPPPVDAARAAGNRGRKLVRG